MRTIYEKRSIKLTDITQGTIFTNAVAIGYKNSEVCGLIITPRCDLAHDTKVTHVHYLPVVPFDDWFLHDGMEYLKIKWESKVREKIIKCCIKYKFPFTDINKDDFETMQKTISNANEQKEFSTLLEKYFTEDSIAKYESEVCNSSSKNSMISNLKSNNLPAYYLLESWNNPKEYVVILLRDLKRISCDFVAKLKSGTYQTELEHDSNEIKMSADNSLFYEPCALVLSPIIEHIMQRFSHNFCRIGVEDIAEETIEILNSKIAGL